VPYKSARRLAFLKQETQQEIVNILNQLFVDLSAWLRGHGLSEAEVDAFFNAAMREDGMLAKSILGRVGDILPVTSVAKVGAAQVAQEFLRFQSGEFATWLLSQPDPTPEELDQIRSLKSALAILRHELSSATKFGPRHRRGGRPKELSDPAEREKIRETIRSLRVPGVKLQDLFQRFATKHGVSPTTIKRIWLERPDQT
jgi:hypothetical protein